MLPIWKNSQLEKGHFERNERKKVSLAPPGPAFSLAVVGGPVTKHPSLGDFKLQKLSRHVLS